MCELICSEQQMQLLRAPLTPEMITGEYLSLLNSILNMDINERNKNALEEFYLVLFPNSISIQVSQITISCHIYLYYKFIDLIMIYIKNLLQLNKIQEALTCILLLGNESSTIYQIDIKTHPFEKLYHFASYKNHLCINNGRPCRIQAIYSNRLIIQYVDNEEIEELLNLSTFKIEKGDDKKIEWQVSLPILASVDIFDGARSQRGEILSKTIDATKKGGISYSVKFSNGSDRNYKNCIDGFSFSDVSITQLRKMNVISSGYIHNNIPPEQGMWHIYEEIDPVYKDNDLVGHLNFIPESDIFMYAINRLHSSGVLLLLGQSILNTKNSLFMVHYIRFLSGILHLCYKPIENYIDIVKQYCQYITVNPTNYNEQSINDYTFIYNVYISMKSILSSPSITKEYLYKQAEQDILEWILMLLNSDSLNKKFFAIFLLHNFFNNAINREKYPNNMMMTNVNNIPTYRYIYTSFYYTPTLLANDLHSRDYMNYFTGNINIEVKRKATELLVILAQYGGIQEQELVVLWNDIKSNNGSEKDVVLSVLISILEILPISMCLIFFQLIQADIQADATITIYHCLEMLVKKKDNILSQHILDTIIDCIEHSAHGSDIYLPLICDALAVSSMEHKHFLLQKYIEALKTENNVIITLSILKEIIDSYPKYSPEMANNQSESSENIVSNQNALRVLLSVHNDIVPSLLNVLDHLAETASSLPQPDAFDMKTAIYTNNMLYTDCLDMIFTFINLYKLKTNYNYSIEEKCRIVKIALSCKCSPISAYIYDSFRNKNLVTSREDCLSCSMECYKLISFLWRQLNISFNTSSILQETDYLFLFISTVENFQVFTKAMGLLYNTIHKVYTDDREDEMKNFIVHILEMVSNSISSILSHAHPKLPNDPYQGIMNSYYDRIGMSEDAKNERNKSLNQEKEDIRLLNRYIQIFIFSMNSLSLSEDLLFVPLSYYDCYTKIPLYVYINDLDHITIEVYSNSYIWEVEKQVAGQGYPYPLRLYKNNKELDEMKTVDYYNLSKEIYLGSKHYPEIEDSVSTLYDEPCSIRTFFESEALLTHVFKLLMLYSDNDALYESLITFIRHLPLNKPFFQLVITMIKEKCDIPKLLSSYDYGQKLYIFMVLTIFIKRENHLRVEEYLAFLFGLLDNNIIEFLLQELSLTNHLINNSCFYQQYVSYLLHDYDYTIYYYYYIFNGKNKDDSKSSRQLFNDYSPYFPFIYERRNDITNCIALSHREQVYNYQQHILQLYNQNLRIPTIMSDILTNDACREFQEDIIFYSLRIWTVFLLIHKLYENATLYSNDPNAVMLHKIVHKNQLTTCGDFMNEGMYVTLYSLFSSSSYTQPFFMDQFTFSTILLCVYYDYPVNDYLTGLFKDLLFQEKNESIDSIITVMNSILMDRPKAITRNTYSVLCTTINNFLNDRPINDSTLFAGLIFTIVSKYKGYSELFTKIYTFIPDYIPTLLLQSPYTYRQKIDLLKLYSLYIKQSSSLDLFKQRIEPVTQLLTNINSIHYFEPSYRAENSIHIRLNDEYVGLQNLGCICYLNSIMQQLYMIPSFSNAILNFNIQEEYIIPKNIPLQKKDEDQLYQLQRLFSYLRYSYRPFTDPYVWCATNTYMGMPLDVREQQDAHEYFSQLIDQLESKLSGSSLTNLMKDIFMGNMVNTMECSSCHYTRHTTEPYYFTSVEVKQMQTLEQALKKHCEKSVIDDYKCDNCNKKVKLLRWSCFESLSNVLIIQLNRFTYDIYTGERVKIYDRLEFPLTLNVYPYTSAAEQNSNCPNPRDYEYKLTGIVIHLGTANSGHYYDYICGHKDEWYQFNDQNVDYEPDFVTRLDDLCFGDDSISQDKKEAMTKASAYILVYTKCIPNEKKVIPMEVSTVDICDDDSTNKNIIPVENSKESIVVNENVMSPIETSSQSTSSDSHGKFYISTKSNESIDDTKQNYTYQSPLNDVMKAYSDSIDASIREEIQKDNLNCLYSAIFYSNEFIDALPIILNDIYEYIKEYKCLNEEEKQYINNTIDNTVMLGITHLNKILLHTSHEESIKSVISTLDQLIRIGSIDTINYFISAFSEKYVFDTIFVGNPNTSCVTSLFKLFERLFNDLSTQTFTPVPSSDTIQRIRMFFMNLYNYDHILFCYTKWNTCGPFFSFLVDMLSNESFIPYVVDSEGSLAYSFLAALEYKYKMKEIYYPKSGLWETYFTCINVVVKAIAYNGSSVSPVIPTDINTPVPIIADLEYENNSTNNSTNQISSEHVLRYFNKNEMEIMSKNSLLMTIDNFSKTWANIIFNNFLYNNPKVELLGQYLECSSVYAFYVYKQELYTVLGYEDRYSLERWRYYIRHPKSYFMLVLTCTQGMSMIANFEYLVKFVDEYKVFQSYFILPEFSDVMNSIYETINQTIVLNINSSRQYYESLNNKLKEFSKYCIKSNSIDLERDQTNKGKINLHGIANKNIYKIEEEKGNKMDIETSSSLVTSSDIIYLDNQNISSNSNDSNGESPIAVNDINNTKDPVSVMDINDTMQNTLVKEKHIHKDKDIDIHKNIEIPDPSFTVPNTSDTTNVITIESADDKHSVIDTNSTNNQTNSDEVLEV
ncbi:hypothetical protein WA158_001103 [Blastocystis sp. Blastoise]